jgi:hypothetical protein
MRRLLSLAVLTLILAAACANDSETKQVTDIYEVSLQGSATADGTLVLSAPSKIEVPVSAGQSALDVALALRDELQRRGHSVICTVDGGARGFSLLVEGRVAISSSSSNLGGIGGAASQVIQRREVVESAVREYLRFLRESNIEGLRRVTTESFYSEASQDLGKGLKLVSVRAPSIGCHTASAIVEIALPGNQHVQNELQLVTDGNLSWRVDGVRELAMWRAAPTPPSSQS